MRKFILGTDWWTDCDDAVAVRLITRAHKRKEIELLGICINACMEHSVSSLSAYLQAENADDIPLGIDKDGTDFYGVPKYQYFLSEMKSRYKNNNDAPDGVSLYRTLLARSDAKVELAEIGFSQVLMNLLLSEPDDVSPLNGTELVKEKVSKLWMMAGKWDKDGEKEHNFCNNERSRKAAAYICESFPAPITFLGFEVGESVITGGELKEDDILKKIMNAHGSFNGRCSWDPMLVLCALTGDEEKAGYTTVKGKASVNESTGQNYFIKDENGKHQYLIKKYSDDYYKDLINKLIK